MAEKVVVITGASEGIGAALAKTLAAEGHRLVLAARRKEKLEAVAATCGQKAIAVVADVTRRADVEAIRDEALRRFGRIDVWVNNAGRGISRKVLELSDAEVDEMMAVNLKSALYGMQVAVPYFQQRGEGQLINVSSFLGRIPMATIRSAYSAAKAALNSITTTLRLELMATHPNIHVTLVMPGMVRTAFAQNALGGTPELAPGRSPPPGVPAAQSAEEVAAAIAAAIANPVPEVYTNPQQARLVADYFQDVAGFERRMASR
ncbi:MAG: SDR family oxidoreductase [Myxococcaceae bacterium]|nr:SDR family oxidoreductase [Myxococcaceae bacterium]